MNKENRDKTLFSFIYMTTNHLLNIKLNFLIMKNFKFNIAFLAMFAMIFTSCSKEETGDNLLNSETATLSFGAIVNGLEGTRAASKQSIGDMPACSDDDPAYVRVVLMQGGVAVVGSSGEPYRVNLAAGQIFTEEDELLELDPGTYTLDHFSVYNEDDELIWLAPRGGDLANFVDVSLPMNIELGAGVKKYVEVPVLCFDNRDVNEYGYLFFELNTNEAVEFCFFANYCDADGRHYSARYSLDVYLGTDASGTPLYSDVVSNTGVNEDGDFFASPVCIALPVSDDDEDYIYYELTLLDWEANYGDVDQNAPANRISGTLNNSDIEANFGAGDEVEYEHFRFGCGSDDGNGNGGNPDVDSDNDGIPDTVDKCPNTPGEEEFEGCPAPAGCDIDDPNADCDNDGVLNGVDECKLVPGTTENNGCPASTSDCIDESGTVLTFERTIDISGFPVGISPFYPLVLNGEQVGTITFNLTIGSNENLVVSVDMFDGSEANQFTDYTITTAELSLPTIDDDSLCETNIDANEFTITWDRENEEALNYPLEVIFRANVLISME